MHRRTPAGSPADPGGRLPRPPIAPTTYPRPSTETTIPDVPSHLESLNPEQRTAARHFEGPILVLAGAGSGKTRVLTVRICELIRGRGVAPERILAVTFTNKAAGEMRERVRRMLGEEPAGLWMGTFHAVGARILRRHAPRLGFDRTFTILDAEQSLREIKRTQELVDVDPKRFHPKAVRAQISDAKNRLIGPERFTEDAEGGFDLFTRQVAKVYGRYQQRLKTQNAMDFDDLLVKPVRLFDRDADVLASYRDRFAFVLVDEYQDTNHAQFRFLELLTSEHGNLMVVGDDDQSIYGWRGADIRNILDFEKTFPDAAVVRLEQNYRSTSRILDAANAVIALNVDRKGKTLRTDRSAGEPVTVVECADEVDEGRCIVGEVERRAADASDPRRYSDFAVLYRTNAQSRALEDAFRRRGLPYQIVGGVRFYERREIQDTLGYLRLISNPLDADAFHRVVNYPRRGVGAVTEERLVEWARAEGLGLLEAAAGAEETSELPTAGARSLVGFAELIRRYGVRASQVPVGELVEELVEELDLLRELRDEGPEGEDRAENVKELVAAAREFDVEVLEDWEEGELDGFTELDLFLQKVALVAEVDRHDPEEDAVTLMTLHNAKGLEFPVVFVAGLEDGLFPLSRAYDEPGELEEERRLFYVGMTRAQDKLILTHARRRRRMGDVNYARVSPFVEAVPDALVEERRTPALEREGRQMGRQTGGFGSRSGRRRQAEAEPDLLVDDDPGLDAGMNQDLPRFVKGERVAHPTFGSGSVVEVTGFGRDLKVTVDFGSVGRKKLLVRYAGLEKDYP